MWKWDRAFFFFLFLFFFSRINQLAHHRLGGGRKRLDTLKSRPTKMPGNEGKGV
jgi:hypothetical protein